MSCVNRDHRVFSSCAQKNLRTGSAESCIIVTCWINCFSVNAAQRLSIGRCVYIAWECAKRKKKTFLISCEQIMYPVQFSGSVWRLERSMPSFKSDGSSINALQSEWNKGNGGGTRPPLAFEKVFHFSTRNKKKKQKSLPLSCAGSLTLT